MLDAPFSLDGFHTGVLAVMSRMSSHFSIVTL
jgi:hypothetical protein